MQSNSTGQEEWGWGSKSIGKHCTNWATAAQRVASMKRAAPLHCIQFYHPIVCILLSSSCCFPVALCIIILLMFMGIFKCKFVNGCNTPSTHATLAGYPTLLIQISVWLGSLARWTGSPKGSICRVKLSSLAQAACRLTEGTHVH